MSGAPTTYRWVLARHRAGALARGLRGALAGPAIGAASFLSPRPSRLVIAPPDLRAGDASLLHDMLAGHFALAGRVLSVPPGGSPFAAEPPSRAFTQELYGFGWLRHLRAAGTPEAQALARALFEASLVGGPPEADEPRVLARRAMAWVSHSPLLLEGADHAFYAGFVAALRRAVLALRRALARTERNAMRLDVLIALVHAGLSLDRTDRLVARHLATLSRELDGQILPDGGHASRDPGLLVELLLNLLPLRQGFVARGLEPPPSLLRAIDRMMPMLRFMRHTDGALALFNGAGAPPRDWLATLLAYDDTRGAGAFDNAPHSGYQRLTAADVVVILDAGLAPPRAQSGRAHAGCLAFEMSAGGRRWIVNCGAPQDESSPAARLARSTAAHSTLTFAETSSCVFAPQRPPRRGGERRPAPILEGPVRVEVQRVRDPERAAIVASHDGYEAAFGIVHRRGLWLSRDGSEILGRDEIVGEPSAERDDAAIRFHLHPTVKATVQEEGRAAILTAPDGQAWRFEAGGLMVYATESVFFSAGDGARRAQQILVETRASRAPAIQWRLTRLTPAPPARLGLLVDPS